MTLVEQRVDALETQIIDLRGDMSARFTSLHTEMNDRFAAMQTQLDSRFDAVEQVLISLQSQIVGTHQEMLRLHDDTMRHMRVLHEDVIERISRIKG